MTTTMNEEKTEMQIEKDGTKQSPSRAAARMEILNL